MAISFTVKNDASPVEIPRAIAMMSQTIKDLLDGER